MAEICGARGEALGISPPKALFLNPKFMFFPVNAEMQGNWTDYDPCGDWRRAGPQKGAETPATPAS
jgi:hypothetical protein